MKKNKTRSLRLTTMTIVVMAVFIGAAGNVGTGSLSAFGVDAITAVCPLGYLETVVAGRDILPQALPSFLVIAGLTVLLGRIFCGWLCPVPLVRKIVINKIDEEQELVEDNAALQADGDCKTVKPVCSQTNRDDNKKPAKGLVVLGVTVGSAAIFGFPVFCLVCPIGLIFATLFALLRLVKFNEPTMDLIIFPLIIIVEFVLFKKWCSKICPLGALLSIFGKFNRRLIPIIDHSRCLEESQGIKCRQCRSACSMDVDLKNDKGTGNLSECTKCRECADNCPVQAIRFPWR
ncbi:MAG: rane-bound polyferredoxin [Firmicutes bacterium]|nr:rane-bound polyferredoxin [Bacillota bacterium]